MMHAAIATRRWYIVHASAGFEKAVAAAIRERANQGGLADYFEAILVPTESVVEMRHGKRMESSRTFFPGYVLTKMDLTEAVYQLIRAVPRVNGFVGAHGRPVALSQEEADRILRQAQKGIERNAPAPCFKVTDVVIVSDGPFASFDGVVEEIDEAREILKVAVSIFGRSTPVELEFRQVRKPAP